MRDGVPLQAAQGNSALSPSQGKATAATQAVVANSRPFRMWVPPSLPPGISETPASPRSHSSSIPPGDQAEGTRPEGSRQPGPGPHQKPEAGYGFPASFASFRVNLPLGGAFPTLLLEVNPSSEVTSAHARMKPIYHTFCNHPPTVGCLAFVL